MSGGFDLAQTDHLLTTTRAVRKRLDLTRAVEPKVLLDCIQIASQAPSGSNAQRWRWIVVTDPEKKKTVAHYYALSFKDYIAPKLDLIEPGDHASVRMTDSASYLAEHMAEVPALVIPCVLDRPPEANGGEQSAGFWGGILPAVWSFQLALRSRGLGSAWTTLHLNYEKEVGDALGVPTTVTQAALLPVAYYTGDRLQAGTAPRRRRADLLGRVEGDEIAVTSLLQDRVAVVTGGTRGIGRAIADAFLAEGAKVVISGRSADKGKEALDEMGRPDRTWFIACDVRDQAEMEALIDGVADHFGGVDILVNNAGGSDGFARIHELSDEAWDNALAWNLNSTFWATRRALPYMLGQAVGPRSSPSPRSRASRRPRRW